MRLGGMTATALAVLSLACASRAAAQASDQGPVTERRDDFDSAAQSPVEDLNLKQVPIPEVLERSLINPYDLRTLDRCVALAAEVQRLDAALGADKDEPPQPDNRPIEEKRENTAAGVLRAGVEAITPYRGIVRFVSGADAHDKKMQDSIEAGFERRGFLKAHAMDMNCPPPASPAWFRPSQVQARPTYSAYDQPPPSAYTQAPTSAYAQQQPYAQQRYDRSSYPAYSQPSSAYGQQPYATYGQQRPYATYSQQQPYPGYGQQAYPPAYDPYGRPGY